MPNCVSVVTYKGEVPDEDVHEGNTQNQSPPADAPPPLSDMDSLQGYENTQFQAGKSTMCSSRVGKKLFLKCYIPKNLIAGILKLKLYLRLTSQGLLS